MAKLRKMLGDPTGPRAKALMALIDTQSASTLGRWAAAYAEERYLPILSRHCSGQPADERFATAIKQAIACADGSTTLKDTKPALRAALTAARETGDADPVAQAAARAISTACGCDSDADECPRFRLLWRGGRGVRPRPGYPPTRRSMSVWRIWNSIGSSRHCGMRPLRMSRTLSRCGGTAETRVGDAR